MKTVLKMAKTVDEAVRLALAELETTRDKAIIEVIEEPKSGLFGLIGSKEAVVRVSVEEINYQMSAVDFLQEMLKKMDLSGTVKVVQEKPVLMMEIVNITERDTGILIGKRGETLDSVQYLVNIVANRHSDEFVRVILDVNNYRKKREDSLVNMAKKTAEKAKKYRRNMRLEPMNPHERRIVHSALQGISGITTVSEGEDPYRKVVIKVNRS